MLLCPLLFSNKLQYLVEASKSQFQYVDLDENNSNKNNNKMKDQTFLNNLADFKDVKITSRNQLLDIENRSRDSFQSKSSSCVPDFDLQLHNNDKLLKNFKELREQLKQSMKMGQKYKTRLDERQLELDRVKQSERDFITTNHHLKSEVEQLRQTNEDLKAKIELLKGLTKNASHTQEEVQFLKITINNMKTQMVCLEDEKNKLLEISIVEKVELEQKIKKFEAKKGSDIQYVQQMEIQVSKLRQKSIKLENQLKKMQIKYEEELYTKQWANGNFEREHLQEQLKQADAENQQLLSKHKKEKEKRNLLQKRVLELEESTGLWIVKAETYQVQNKALQKKFKQLQKKMEQFKEQSNRKVSQVLALEEKFAKSTSIADELISRVKRQLYGDIVALAKSCEFKINKLKQQKEGFFKNTEEQQLRRSVTDIKARSKSKVQARPFSQKELQSETQAKPTFINLREKFEQCLPKTLNESNDENCQKSKSNKSETSRSINPLGQIENIEARIKKQRDEMEKKIREKMLYRKLEVAHSPEKHQLREDYFRLLDH